MDLTTTWIASSIAERSSELEPYATQLTKRWATNVNWIEIQILYRNCPFDAQSGNIEKIGLGTISL